MSMLGFLGLDGVTKAATDIAADVTTIVNRFVPDPDKALDAKTQIELAMQANLAQRYQAMALVMAADDKGDSLLTRIQRPIVVMWSLSTITLIMGLGLAGHAEPVLQALREVPDKVWELITYGVGIYTAGRTVEKATTTLVGAFKK